MARKKTVSKSKDTRRRYTDEFKEEAVQMMLDETPHAGFGAAHFYRRFQKRIDWPSILNKILKVKDSVAVVVDHAASFADSRNS